MENKAVFSNEKYDIFILTSCIFKLKPKLGIELDVNDGYEMRKIFLSFSKGNKFAVLTDATNFFQLLESLDNYLQVLNLQT